VLESVDKADLGSVGLMLVGVRLPPCPPVLTEPAWDRDQAGCLRQHGENPPYPYRCSAGEGKRRSDGGLLPFIIVSAYAGIRPEVSWRGNDRRRREADKKLWREFL
jgi:hypothetical protein